jgi:hypothetical protein
MAPLLSSISYRSSIIVIFAMFRRAVVEELQRSATVTGA